MSENNLSGGIGLMGALFLIFLTLKLTGVIAWSWWWVTAPLWGGLAVVAGFFALALIFGGIVFLIVALTRRGL